MKMEFIFHIICIQLGNYGTHRIASRLSSLYTKVANLLLLTLPGTPLCYYGDEIGMQDIELTSLDQVKDFRAINDPVRFVCFVLHHEVKLLITFSVNKAISIQILLTLSFSSS